MREIFVNGTKIAPETRAPKAGAARGQCRGSTGTVQGKHGDSSGAARGQWCRGSTGTAKCPFQEMDFRAIFIHIDILNSNKI